RFHTAAQFIAVHFGHDHVADDECGLAVTRRYKCLAAVGGDGYEVVLSFEDVLESLGLRGAVFHDQDFHRWPFGFRRSAHGSVLPALCLRLTSVMRVSAILSAGKTWVAPPSAIASAGMPCTTERSRSWAKVVAPLSFMSFNSAAPSLPIPVSRTPSAFGPHDSASDRNRQETAGRRPLS